MPRRYRMDARATAVEQTRQHIVEAAKNLHAEHGFLGTSYEEIARQANVATATVYRQFPSLSDLIPACARSIPVFHQVDDDEVAALFRGIADPFRRLEWLIRGTCDCYERDGNWINAAWREEGLVPAAGAVVRVQEESLQRLVRAAVDGTSASARTLKVLVALIDFPFWQSLRRAGLSSAEAVDQIVALVRDQLSGEDDE